MTCGWVNDDRYLVFGPFTFYFSYISVSLYLLIWLRLFLMLSLPISISLSIHISPSPSFPIFFLPLQFHYTILVSLLYFPISLFPYLLVSFPISPHTFTHPLHPVSMIDFDWTAWFEGDCRSHPFYHRLLQTPNPPPPPNPVWFLCCSQFSYLSRKLPQSAHNL